MPVNASKRYRAFAIDQAGEISGMLRRKAVDLDSGDQVRINARAPEKKTATAGVAVKLVEAAGQPVRPFRDGLDYAFILSPGCGACYPAGMAPDPSARPAFASARL